ncbi:hypothetical protein M5D96_000418 [Drosophila gunungcola]|uniref:Uncharacterized protein n=1 Tax=Drosophila gunungcola TaxID=103775 RepID=A0A9Q0BTM2_9MUSC|nr:hypothetical protein M5D96_000418 [Drosophila gunungcola]
MEVNGTSTLTHISNAHRCLSFRLEHAPRNSHGVSAAAGRGSAAHTRNMHFYLVSKTKTVRKLACVYVRVYTTIS